MNIKSFSSLGSMALALSLQTTAFASSASTELISPRDLSIKPISAMGRSTTPDTSADGRFIVFASEANDLIKGDTNGRADVYVYDRLTSTHERISVASDGTEGNADSYDPSISADGRYVVFTTDAFNLIPDDMNFGRDVYLHDRLTHTTKRVSVNSKGEEAQPPPFTPDTADSDQPSLSADGRYLAFRSNAVNLNEAGETFGEQIYVRDLVAGRTQIITVAPGGKVGDGQSSEPDISPDGSYVAYASQAPNLVLDDTNGVSDVFLYERLTGTTTRVSLDSNGAQATQGSSSPALDSRGLFIAFVSLAALVPGDTNGWTDIYYRDRRTNKTVRVSSDGPFDVTENFDPAVNANGRYIAYSSTIAQSVGTSRQIFLYNTLNGQRTQLTSDNRQLRFSVGSTHPAMPADGRYVAFASTNNLLVPGDGNLAPDIFVHDLTAKKTSLVTMSRVFSRTSPGLSVYATQGVSGDGRLVAFASESSLLVPGDTTDATDAFLRDRNARKTTRLSVNAQGVGGDENSLEPVMSDDGRYVAFPSRAGNFDSNNFFTYDIFVRDLQTGTLQRESLTSEGAELFGESRVPTLSSNGRYLVFMSDASNLHPDQLQDIPNVYIRDRQTGITELVSVSTAGEIGNAPGSRSAISSDGRFVVFESFAWNLVPGDNNDSFDIFLRDRLLKTTTRISVNPTTGAEGENDSYKASISSDGRYIGFSSLSSTLVPGDVNEAGDVFLYDRETGSLRIVSLASDGAQGNGHSEGYISNNARYIAFESNASNLVPGDTNEVSDAFVRDLQTGVVTRESVGANGEQANNLSEAPWVTDDGRTVTFVSLASNLVPDDLNETLDVFVRKRPAP